MRKLLLASLLLNLALLVWIAWREAPVASGAEAGGGATAPCADLNSDGKHDLSDAMHLLRWLFLGGPEPTCPDISDPLARIEDLEAELEQCRAARSGTLPATGQTETFGDHPGQDGQYRTGCPPDGRFVDHGDGTITDTCTGLTWQQVTADVNDDGVVDASDVVNWFDALLYCESLTLGGEEDWRLPNVRELQSLVDYGRYNVALDPLFTALPSWYWTSTTEAEDSISAWYVDFAMGYVYRDNSKANRHFVRAVRGGV